MRNHATFLHPRLRYVSYRNVDLAYKFTFIVYSSCNNIHLKTCTNTLKRSGQHANNAYLISVQPVSKLELPFCFCLLFLFLKVEVMVRLNIMWGLASHHLYSLRQACNANEYIVLILIYSRISNTSFFTLNVFLNTVTALLP